MIRRISFAVSLTALVLAGCGGSNSSGNGGEGGSSDTGGSGGSSAGGEGGSATGGKIGTGGKGGSSAGGGGGSDTGGRTGTGGSGGSGGDTGGDTGNDVDAGIGGEGGSGGDVPDAATDGRRRDGGAAGAGGTGGKGGSGGTGGKGGSGGTGGKGGSGGTGGKGGAGGMPGSGGSTGAGCDAAGLVWKTANKTTFESYPAPGSEECIKYSGCDYLGEFQACPKAETKDWVMAHNIVAFFPLGKMALHDLCLKSGSKTIVVTVYDTCGDSDCGGCCTENKGSQDALIDLEKYTDDRFGVSDGVIQWADLGPTKGSGCN